VTDVLAELRTCANCAVPLARKPGERLFQYRIYCSVRCRVIAAGKRWNAIGKAKRHANPKKKRTPLWDLFQRYVYPEPNTGCHLWAGVLGDTGYGRFTQRLGNKTFNVQAHRFAYEHAKGPIPAGMEIDHLCRVRVCVNPDHLEAVTRKENWRRSNGTSATNARKTHCKRGHPLSGENLYVTPQGYRQCRTCINEKSRRWREGRRMADG
jgi:hypothetical protein